MMLDMNTPALAATSNLESTLKAGRTERSGSAVISVLTAVHPAGAGYLKETAESVLSQETPEGWELEWVIQEDGLGESGIRESLPDDPRIKFEVNGAQLGASGTRNLALRRVSGELVQNLDADDLLLPGALLNHIGVLESDPDLHWVVGQADDSMPDGSRKAFSPDLPFGRIAAGSVNSWAIDHDGNWPIHCAGLMYRTASLRALGGWGGLPFDEDIILFSALSEIAHGWFTETVTWLYRQHPNQMVRSGGCNQWSESARTFALQRVLAVRAVGLTISAVLPGWDGKVFAGPSRKKAGSL
jgi:glycosyltransferase involved in cell wall biosynthesis